MIRYSFDQLMDRLCSGDWCVISINGILFFAAKTPGHWVRK